MTQNEYFLQVMRACSESDVIAFEEYTQGLPKRLPSEPFHCGPYNLRAFRFALGNEEPNVLELGFNLGYSAACLLGLGARHLTSVEIRHDERVAAAIHKLGARYGEKIDLGISSTRNPGLAETLKIVTEVHGVFDLAFVDAAHDEENVYGDIALCLKLGIESFLLDDWHPHWGPGVQAAAVRHGLVPIAVFGAVAYCVTANNLIFVENE